MIKLRREWQDRARMLASPTPDCREPRGPNERRVRADRRDRLAAVRDWSDVDSTFTGRGHRCAAPSAASHVGLFCGRAGDIVDCHDL
jgi:hypothetical protein